jgi:hypothetical protein
MKKIFIFISTILLYTSCNNQAVVSSQLPAKISDIPIGIEVKHNKQRVLATINQKHSEKYVWKYETSVKAIRQDLKIIEFGGFIKESGKWIEKNITSRPFNSQEFEEWYNCRAAIAKKGIIYTDTNNWSKSTTLESESKITLWYFIGENSNKKRFVGFQSITIVNEVN